MKQKFEGNSSINILCEDFFEHHNSYDLVLEQTFFSAIPPFKRNEYVTKMYELLTKNGRIVGVLFNKQFNNSFPPFGGDKNEYQTVFETYFEIQTMEKCYNSISSRQDIEVFVNLKKKS